MRAMSVMVGVVLSLVAIGCGSTSPETPDAVTAGSPVDWRSLGCAEPAALVAESSNALETDVGLAAGSLAERYGLTVEEAQRRLRLQEVLGQAMTQVQAAETGRVARTELQHEPTFAAVVTLTGFKPISDITREVLCRTPELEVRFGAAFTQVELANETVRLSRLIGNAVPGLTGFGPGDGELQFDVVDDLSRDQLDALLGSITSYPYLITSQGLPPLVLDPSVPFPLLDTTGRAVIGPGLSGTLTIEGPCVYLGDGLVILPARETRWDAIGGVLNIGGSDMRSGDIVMGGGYQYDGSLDDLDQPPDPVCRVDGGVTVATFAPINPSATPAPAPPEPVDASLFQLEPPNPQAGESFSAFFDPDNSRGGYFYLNQWESVTWSEPRFLLESGSDREPSATRLEGEGPILLGYGVGGAGPDPLIMPNEIEPGQWRLCTANAREEVCTQITIGG